MKKQKLLPLLHNLMLCGLSGYIISLGNEFYCIKKNMYQPILIKMCRKKSKYITKFVVLLQFNYN